MRVNHKLILLLILLVVVFQEDIHAGPIAAGICYSGCNAVWVACVSAGGGTAGVSTGGAAVPAAIIACNAAQGVCMANCMAALAAPTP